MFKKNVISLEDLSLSWVAILILSIYTFFGGIDTIGIIFKLGNRYADFEKSLNGNHMGIDFYRDFLTKEIGNYVIAQIYFLYTFGFFFMMCNYLFVPKKKMKTVDYRLKVIMVIGYPFAWIFFVFLLLYVDLKNLSEYFDKKKLGILKIDGVIIFTSFVVFYNIMIWVVNKTMHGRIIAKLIFCLLNVSFLFPSIIGIYFKYFPYPDKKVIRLVDTMFPTCIVIVILTIIFQLYLWLFHDKLADKLHL